MTHPAVYVVSFGLAVGALLFSYFISNRTYERPYSYNYDNSSKGGFILDENSQCTICLSATNNEEEKTYLDCGHSFHTNCIQPWLRRSEICPNCRQKISSR